MTTYMKVQPATDQAVQIFDSELKLDTTIYRVVAQDRNIISLKIVCGNCKGVAPVTPCKTCNGTGEVGKRRVHHSRIARVLDDTLNVIYEVDSITKEKPMTQEKQAAKVAPASTSIPDLKTLIGSGEHFTKGVSFDHSTVAAQAHIVINADHKSFIVFNTYNGALGKGKAGKQYGKQYPIADEAAYTNKVTQLTKQGYTKS